jgi:multiple antibiotic resistance protein
MDDQLLKFGLTAFTTLLVVVDGFGIAMLFLIAGHEALTYLGVTVHAFSISGGVLLFATALPMLFGHRPGLQSAGEVEGDQADPAIFPLAIPLLAGPGTITTILLLAAQSRDSIPRLLIVALSLAVVFVLTWIILGFATQHVLRRLGPGGLHVATRVLGILLAALAVQFVLNGITDYVRLLQTPAN